MRLSNHIHGRHGRVVEDRDLPVRAGSLAALAPLALVAALSLVALVAVPTANALTTHIYEQPRTEKVAKALPVGSEVLGAVADGGHVWLTEKRGVDELDGGSGGVVKAPLSLEGGLTEFLGSQVGVGHVGGESVYALASRAGQGVVGVYGGGGGFLSAWTGALTKEGSFTEVGGKREAEVAGVAVDGFAGVGDWASGDVYVATSAKTPGAFTGFDVVDVFNPGEEGVAGEETKPVAELTGPCASPGACAEGERFQEPAGVVVSGFDGDVLVADRPVKECYEPAAGTPASGCVVDVFAPEAGAPGVYKFLFAITQTPAGLLGRLNGISVDRSDGDIYLADSTSNVVDEFSATGGFLGSVAGTGESSLEGLTGVGVVDEAGVDDLWVSDVASREGHVDVFGPNVVLPDVKVGAATEVQPESVVLNGTVALAKGGEAECQFEYGTGGYEDVVKCPHPAVGGVGEEEAVSAPVLKLQPDTTYLVRLSAKNANGQLNTGTCPEDCGEFKTSGPGIRQEFATHVTDTGASLGAVIDPDGRPARYRFEYDTRPYAEGEGPHGTSIPVGGEAIGSASSGEGKGVRVGPWALSGLEPGKEYHYRVVVESELETAGNPETRTFAGPDRTFMTQGVGGPIKQVGGSLLPDGRQWEQVSPQNKHGAQIEPLGQAGLTQAGAQASDTGDAFAFLTDTPTETNPAGYVNGAQELAARGADGWGSQDITPGGHSTPTGLHETSKEYVFFSEDLARAVVQPEGAFASLSPQATEQTAYLRSNFPAGTPTQTCQQECFMPLVTAGNDTASPFVAFGEEGACPPKASCGPSFVGATPDGSEVVLRSKAPLTKGAGAEQLYEASATGSLALVSMLPGGGPAGQPELGLKDHVVRHAVSDDGSLVFWEDAAHHLYVRDVVLGETVQVDTVQGGSGLGLAEARFQLASADGSRVFFTDQQKLTAGSGARAEAEDLYECMVTVVAGRLHCALSDVTAQDGAEHAGVLGLVLGASEDGSWVYFVADGALAPGAVKGTCTLGKESSVELCNLYVWHEGVIGLVAVLSGEDAPDWNGLNSPLQLEAVVSQVSGDGRWLVFMSDRSLTGRDMRDARSGIPVEQVYLAHTQIDGGGVLTGSTLVCVSCLATGGRPTGVEYDALTPGIDGNSTLWPAERLLAGSVPAWTESQESQVGDAVYQSRFVFGDGRVVFNSVDGLVAGDVNGVGDVYEWEPEGVGGEHSKCGPAAAGRTDVFEPARTATVEGRTVEEPAGCVALISSGTSSEESGFLDASATGGKDSEGHEGAGDVFFFTSAKLAASDVDEARDVYDAHECRSEAPCFPTQAQAPPPCTEPESCRAPQTPQPGIYGPPASATFNGPGNITPPPPSGPKPPTAAEIRTKHLTAALATCRKKYKHAKKRRASCEKAARKAYAAKQSGRKKK